MSRDFLTGEKPGLIDLQVNGFMGWDINSADVNADTVIQLTRSLWAEGVTTYLPTVITASEEKTLHCLSAIAEARRKDQKVAHTIAGIHMEGPAIAADDGPRGAHDAEHLRLPSLDELKRWQHAGDGLVKVVTLAPELDGSSAYIRAARSEGVLISIGHSAARSEQVHRAVEAGASLSTHLGNGTYEMLPRHPNHIWAQLANDGLTAMFLADGHHLPADTVTAMIRAKGPQRCVFASDSAALAGKPAGEYVTPVGGNVTVRDDGALNLTGTSLLAGSGRSLRGCLQWALENLPFAPNVLFDMATTNPAKILGMETRVSAGSDSVRFESGEVVSTTIAGSEVYQRP